MALHFVWVRRPIEAASVARKKRSVLGSPGPRPPRRLATGLGPFRDYMCTWLTALAVLRYAPDYGDFGATMVMFPECASLLPGYACFL